MDPVSKLFELWSFIIAPENDISLNFKEKAN